MSGPMRAMIEAAQQAEDQIITTFRSLAKVFATPSKDEKPDARDPS